MGQISYTGAFSGSTLSVADVYINIQPPGNGTVTSALANALGYVGVASWGPLNKPTSYDGSTPIFGPGPVVRQNDLLTAAAVALGLQSGAGVGTLLLSRVSDGTDTAASVLLGGALALTVTSKYSGTAGNAATATLAAGSPGGTWVITIQVPGLAAEVFDNVGKGLTANALWLALAAAVNNGITNIQGPSQLVTVSAGASVAAPAAASAALTGGSHTGLDR